MIEGESGLMACSPPWNKPRYMPSRGRVVWPNGAVALLLSAERPDRFRGKQCDTIWAEELASWRYPEAWDQLQLGFRLGSKYGVSPRAVISTTPRPIALIRNLLKDPDAKVVRGSTYENRANLAPAFMNRIIRKYEGTRLGRQELYAHLLEDAEGALWQRDGIEALRIGLDPETLKPRKDVLPHFRRVVVSVDPAVTDKESSNETGIVVTGIGENRHGYVLGDYSGRYSPDAWARKAIKALDDHKADEIVVETNQGGDLVEANIRTVRRSVKIVRVHASRGKRTRAEPIAALYEQGRVHHVGSFPKLEDEMCNWEPGNDSVAVSDPDDPTGEVHELSPDRMDALVWGLTRLMVDKDPDATGGRQTTQTSHFDDAGIL